jgi:hypothetical protein
MAKYAKQRDPYTIKHLLPYFGDMKLAHISREKVEDYMLDRDEAEDNPEPATIYQEYSLGRRIFNVVREKWKLTRENPFADVTFSELLTIDNRRD